MEKILEALRQIETHLGDIVREVSRIREELDECPDPEPVNPPEAPYRSPWGFTAEQKLDVCILIEAGSSGSRAGAKVGVTSSTANTWYREWTGEYRNGSPMPAGWKPPPWVDEARKILKARKG